MKKILQQFLLLVALFTPAIGFSQSYSINWYKVSGGGGTSTGGVYSVSGTIGQHDASTAMTGASYSLTGGFWSIYAVQTPNAPLLTIFLTSTNTAIVSWPVSTPTFALQQTGNLNPTNWVSAVGNANIVNGSNQVTVLPTGGSLFYRLFYP